MNASIYNQKGFTLVELMVSIVLGLLITAAAVQLFITGQASLNIQRSMADIQDNGNVGLNYLISDIRKANLDASQAVMTDQSAYGGVVLRTDNIPLKDALGNKIVIPNALLSFSGAGSTGLSNTNQNSDQLVIQYRANQAGGFDCEGGAITAADVAAGTYIIQRYFLRADIAANTNAKEPNAPLVLACSAGRYHQADLIIANYTNVNAAAAGEAIMRRVDHFHVLLVCASQSATGDFENYRYLTIAQYQAIPLTDPRPRVLAIQLGLIVRAVESVGSDAVIPVAPVFNVLDQQNVTIKTPTGTPPKYLRQVVTQTVTLRNGFGLSGAL